MSGSGTPHIYREGFFEYLNIGSRRSAKAVVARFGAVAAPASILDVGCGQGAWLAEWRSAGIADIAGADGQYVDETSLLIPPAQFRRADLAKPLDLGRRFDLVQSLEVAEHLPESAADAFVDSLVRHGDIVMFSAATPGQGGEHHVNEQPLAYWRRKFASRGFRAFDSLRPLLRGEREIEPWYRYNIVLYANAVGEGRLTKAARASRIPENAPIAEFAPLSWRLRCAALRAAPQPAIEFIARAKHSLVRMRAKSQKGAAA